MRELRKRICFDYDWKFFLGDLPPRTNTDSWGGAKAKAFYFGATAVDFDDSGWRTVDVPHDFIMEGDYTRKHDKFIGQVNIPAMETIDNRHVAGGSLEGNIGWYRKTFHIPEVYETKRIYLYFDGIFRESTVYLNEYDIGIHSDGYTSFYYDITDFVNFGGKNHLAVRVDATGREGWWYEGGGIYRHVWLEVVDPVHVVPWGTFVSAKPDTDLHQSSKAEIHIQTELTNKLLNDETITLESVILNASDEAIKKTQEKLQIEQWGQLLHKQSIQLDNVHFWDLDDPYLYKLRTHVYRNGHLVDAYETDFGIRSIYFDKDMGFYLNGKNIKIKGVCCHHDHAGVGIAVPDRILEYRLEKIKEMGCNAYRCSHNPPAKELLDMCDRMGILVLDETRKFGSSNEHLEQLRSMVKRDRNHPSVILWSIGNEEVFAQDKIEAGRIARTMRMEIRKLDPTRPVTMAFCCFNGKSAFDSGKAFIPVSKELDMMGFNYASKAWAEYHELMPEQPMIITEASANSSTRGCYKTDEISSQYYILDPDNKGKGLKKDVAENEWKMVAENSYLSGIFIWTGFDYRGEPTPFSYPAISSQFGVMDYCGFPKDNYYYYKSWWGTEPVLHIFPHWNWPDMVGEPLSVYCYSNLDEVELFVNGISQGKKIMERNWYLCWNHVIYEPGVLSAVGYIDRKRVLSKQVMTTDSPFRLELLPDREVINGDRQDVAIITVRVLDKNGLIVPTADNLIRFHIEGAGRLLGVGNGNPASHESDKYPLRRAFNGLCQLIVQSKEEKGEIKITASSEGIRKDCCVIKVHE